MKGKCDAPIKSNVNPGQNPNLHCIIATLIPLAWVYCDPSSDMALYEITHSIAATLYPPFLQTAGSVLSLCWLCGWERQVRKTGSTVAFFHTITVQCAM